MVCGASTARRTPRLRSGRAARRRSSLPTRPAGRRGQSKAVVADGARRDMNRSAVFLTKSHDEKAAGIDPIAVTDQHDFQSELSFFEVLKRLAVSPEAWSDNRLLLRGLHCLYCGGESANTDNNGSHGCIAKEQEVPVESLPSTTRTKSRDRGLYCKKYLYPRDLLEHPFLGESTHRDHLRRQIILTSPQTEALGVDGLVDAEWARTASRRSLQSSSKRSLKPVGSLPRSRHS
jgi:hypothetical protein